jgi:arylsulfatase A-like enzyme
MRRLYAASIRSLDAWIGELLDGLEQARLLDDTLVIITADHGENLGEGGMMGHSFSLDERLLRVPLVASGPVALGAGDVLSLAGLPNRLAAALELADHPWEKPFADGIAVAQFDPPTEPGDPRNEELLSLWGLEDPDGSITRRFTTEMSCATDGRMKVLRRGSDEEVFDLRVDPTEATPLDRVAKDAPELELLRSELDRAAALATPAPLAATQSATTAETEDLEERMRLLGYM